MFARFSRAVKRDDPTPEEWRSLFSLRRECLDHATAMVNGGVEIPVSERWGWVAKLTRLGRDADGSLMASVVVTDPDDKVRVLRNVRLVKQARLNL
jgi:hypothetical protein